MFDIAFIGTQPELQDEGWYGLWGQVTLGDHRESFLSSLSLWSRADYERQWLEAATRLVGGEERSAFFTSAFRFWWTMWSDGVNIRVHEELLTAERLERIGSSPGTAETPYHLLYPYHSVSDGGNPISEWQLSLVDIRTYLARLADH